MKHKIAAFVGKNKDFGVYLQAMRTCLADTRHKKAANL